MHIATANVQCRPVMDQPLVVADLTEVGDRIDVGGLQEIRIERYRRAVNALAHTHGLVKVGRALTSEPIVFRDGRVRLIESGSAVLTGGAAGICEARDLTWAHLEDLVDGGEFVHIDTHYPAKAWGVDGGPRRFRRTSDQVQRQRLWRACRRRNRRLVKSFLRRGLPVVVTADWNRLGPGDLLLGRTVARRRVQYAKHGLDAIAFIDSGRAAWRVKPEPEVVKLNSDHMAIVATAFVQAVR